MPERPGGSDRPMPDRPPRNAAPVEDPLPAANRGSPLAAPRAGGQAAGRGPPSRAPQRPVDDEDDFADTDVGSLLG